MIKKIQNIEMDVGGIRRRAEELKTEIEGILAKEKATGELDQARLDGLVKEAERCLLRVLEIRRRYLLIH